MTGKQHTAQNVGGPVITITTIRHSLQWHTLSSWTVKPLIFFSLFFTSFFVISCTTTPLETSAPPVLKLEEVSCTEAWYRLTAHGYKLPLQAEVYRDNKLTSQFTVNTFEKIFYIDSLLPKHSYTVSVSLTAANGEKTTLSENIETMDTTSFTIQWKYWLFGTIPSSIVWDIAKTDDGKVGAACEIWKNDSLNMNYYNWIQKDGDSWKITRLPFLSIQPGNPNRYYFSLSTTPILGNKLLTSSAGSCTIWDGDSANNWLKINQQISRFWKKDDNNIYGSTLEGNIAYFNGEQFTTIKTGSDIPLYDITGDKNTGEVYACGYKHLRSVIYRYKDNSLSQIWSEINSTALPGTLGNYITTCSVIGKQVYFAGSTGMVHLLSLLDITIAREAKCNNVEGLPAFKMKWMPVRIRGMAANDIYILCDNNELWHFNGYRWNHINNIPFYMNYPEPLSILVEKDEIYITGCKGIYGLIIQGRRVAGK